MFQVFTMLPADASSVWHPLQTLAMTRASTCSPRPLTEARPMIALTLYFARCVRDAARVAVKDVI
jgi:hypothetical protein